MLDLLPVEVLMLIFQNVNRPIAEAVKKCRIVSKSWKCHLEKMGFLSSWIMIVDACSWKMRMNSDVFSYVGGLKLEMFTRKEKHSFNSIMQSIMEKSNLHTLDLSSQNISPRLIQPLVFKVTNLHLSNVTVKPKDAEDWEEFFSTIATSKDLKLKFISLSEDIHMQKNVSPDIFANALCRLSTVNAKLVLKSARTLSETIVNNNSVTITDLNLRYSKLRSGNNDELIASAICKIETVGLFGTCLSVFQLYHIYNTIVYCDNLVLKYLDVRDYEKAQFQGNLEMCRDLYRHLLDLFSQAILKLKSFKGTCTEDEVNFLLKNISQASDFDLEHLQIYVNDKGVPNEALMTICKTKLKTLVVGRGQELMEYKAF